MIKRYFIDRSVLSVLMKTTDEKLVEENFQVLVVGLNDLIENTMDEIFVKNGIDIKFKDVVNKDSNQVSKEIVDLLKDSKTTDEIDKNTQLYFKLFVDAYWSNLTDVEKLDVEGYMNGFEDLQREQNKLMLESLQIVDEVEDAMQKNQPAVNLGGVTSVN